MLNQNQQKIIDKTSVYVEDLFAVDGSGHDWWHIFRVWKTATRIADLSSCDMFVVQLAALLHDIADWKYYDGDLLKGPERAREYLETMNVEGSIIQHVCEIIEHISFKGVGEENRINTLEGEIVQDADRLDAIGAIGIARAFAFGGSRNRLLYHPNIKPEIHADFEGYKNNQSPTINHFYEKLLLLKDRMNTEIGKQIAEERHSFLELFLKKFFQEWDREDI